MESSRFGSEFTAMKQCCEYLQGLVYKLRMSGISWNIPVYLEADNRLVLEKTIIPESTLKKNLKYFYNTGRKGIAQDD